MDPFDDLPDSTETQDASTSGSNSEGLSALELWRVGERAERDEFARGAQKTWRDEMPRWLATLNPGRTGREYEKALGYFFETPGVPQRLKEISFDLLLAYRGSLALRAASRDRPQSARSSRSAEQGFDARLGAPWMAALPSHSGDTDGEHEGVPRPASNGDLAPATVNIRLTALRQFLVHCALLDLSPALTPDRIRAALRRLSIERRRPYQVLAEPEWGAFLKAALEPGVRGRGEAHSASEETLEPAEAVHAPGPWGLSRAERAERKAHADELSAGDLAAKEHAPAGSNVSPKRLPRSRAGLTGARTAQRDHSLLSLALATGLRAIELVSLDVGDLSREWHKGREEWWLVLPDAKTKGQRGGRTLPLAPSLVETLLSYVKSTGRRWEQGSDRKTPLFLSIHGRTNGSGQTSNSQGQAARPSKPNTSDARFRRLSTTQVREIVDRVELQWLAQTQAESATNGLAGESRTISPHALRHSTALALLEGDGASRPPASVEHVRGWLGHFDIRTTQGYLAHLDARRNRRPFVLEANAPAQARANESSRFFDENETPSS